MREMVFIVREASDGWYVEDGSAMGPFISLERAKDLADGMASALAITGTLARVEIHRLEREEPPER
jgi:hypothetical protein